MRTLLNPSCMNVSPPGTSYWRMSSPRLMASLWVKNNNNNKPHKNKKTNQEKILLKVLFFVVDIFL